MSCSENKYNYVGENFTIENNILKGIYKELDLSAQSAGEVILKHLSNKPNHVGQIEAETEKSTNHGKMKEEMIRCALWLRKQCIGKDDVIAICTHNHLDAYIPCFATFLVGAIYNPWHHEVSLKVARHLIYLTQPKVVFVCESALKTMKEAARLENLDPIFIVFGKDAEHNSLNDIMMKQTDQEIKEFKPEPIKGRNDTAMIMFSSGTTGLPKGVQLSYDSVLRLVSGTLTLPSENMFVLWYSSLYWISGTSYMIRTLMNNGTRIIHSNTDPEETCKIIEKFQINCFFLIPSMVKRFSISNALKKYKLESMQIIWISGAKISNEALQDLRNSLPKVNIIQGYGMTEAGRQVVAQTKKCKKSESVGFVLPYNQVKIVDIESGKSLGPYQTGECFVKTSTTMMGYYKNPAATKATIDDEGWIHTGDILYYTKEGELLVVDRIKEVMKFRGHHVSPSELEEILLKHPAVMEVAVVPVPHDVDLERPMAFVKKVSGTEVTEDELVEMTSELGEFKKLWGGVRFLEEMPYTGTGKINKKDLQERAKFLGNCKF